MKFIIGDLKASNYNQIFIQAIETLLTAYEKEKEEHKKECHNCDEYTAKLGELKTENKMLKSELEKEKKKNKELDKENQGLFELYNFNDSSLLAKILKDYKKIIEKQSKEIEELYQDNLTLIQEINQRWLAKIKAKVIEIKNRPVKDEFITASLGKLNTIIEIESLLEKE